MQQNFELRIGENVRQRSADSSIKPFRLEDAIEEFQNYYIRHLASCQKLVSTAFAITENDSRPNPNIYVFGDNKFIKECYYLNPDLRPSGWLGKEQTYYQINQALADPRRYKMKSLIDNITKCDGEQKGTGDVRSTTAIKQASSNFISGQKKHRTPQNL